MKFKIDNRHSLSVVAILLYLVPFLFFSYYSIDLMSKNKSWSILSLGLLIVTGCSFVLMLFIFYWEQALRLHIQEKTLQPEKFSEKLNKVTAIDSSLESESVIRSDLNKNINHINLLQPVLRENQDPTILIIDDLLEENEEDLRAEEETKVLAFEYDKITKDFSDYKLFSEEQLKQKNLLITNLQEIVDTVQGDTEKKQLRIQELDTKIRDLNYEIKTLLYLHDNDATVKRGQKSERTNSCLTHSPPYVSIESKPPGVREEIRNSLDNNIKTVAEASNLLRRCITLAQKLSGNHYYGNETSRYWEVSTPHYTIDQRRLFDSLRNEVGAIILVYSPRDSRVLFVNNQCKEILGWSPEKFIQDFGSIIQDGLAEWKKSLSLLNAATIESQARLLMKSKNGQEMMMNCHLGNISNGVFKNYIIGILYLS